MLKIKNDVDLEKLKEFGFVKGNTMGENFYKKSYFKGFYKEKIIIWEKDREIQVQAIKLLNTLYDLITAGLVEKIEE